MWGHLLGFVRAVLTLARRVNHLEDEVKRLKDEREEDRTNTKKLAEKNDRIVELTQRLTFELQRLDDKAETDRRMLMLEVENLLLRQRPGLPPGRHDDASNEPNGDRTDG